MKNTRIRIGIDAMGGDFAPMEPVLAALQFAADPSLNVLPVLFGDSNLIESVLKQHNETHSELEVVHCTEVISMSDHATRAISQKKDSSIVVGYQHLAAGKIDAFLSAGNTGAMMVGALYSIKPIEGINRPALTSVLPRPDGSVGILLDVGANSDCKAETLNQFATLGSVYYKTFFSSIGSDPKVGLLSIGEEKEKGNLLTQATYPLLENNPKIHFVGNVEGRDLFNQKVDVVVCDGFVGNIILKVCEGLYYNLMKQGIQDDYLNRFNFKHYGGTPILGVNAPVIIGHGISKSDTFIKMIEMAVHSVKTKMTDKIKSSF